MTDLLVKTSPTLRIVRGNNAPTKSPVRANVNGRPTAAATTTTTTKRGAGPAAPPKLKRQRTPNKAKEEEEKEEEKHVHICKEPFTCSLFLYNNSHKKVEHEKQFRHVCLYGKSCKKLGDPEHRKMCIHLNKETCNLNTCTKLSDPAHRARYHHPGFWDYLLPCRYHKKCKDIGNAEHNKKYQHEALPVFPHLN